MARQGPNHGGKRPGSGRKTKEATKIQADINATVNARIEERMGDLVEAMMGLALGHWIEEVTPDGPRNVYVTPPDRSAAMYLMDRRLGKPKLLVEGDGAEVPRRIILHHETGPNVPPPAAGDGG